MCMELLPRARHCWVGDMMVCALTQAYGNKSLRARTHTHTHTTHTHTHTHTELMTIGGSKGWHESLSWRVWGLGDASLRVWVWSWGLKGECGGLGRGWWGGGGGAMEAHLGEKDGHKHRPPTQGPGATGRFPASMGVLTMDIWLLRFYVYSSFLS